MSRRLPAKRKSTLTLADRAVDVIQRWWVLIAGIYAATLMAYTKLSRLFSGFGWVDAVVAGLIGAIFLTSATVLLLAGYRSIRPVVLPPRDRKTFLEEDVWLADLVGPRPIIAHRRFERCVLRGPGQIKFANGVSYLFCAIEERNGVVAQHGSNITGAVLFVDCQFVECYFDVAVVGTPQDIEQLKKSCDFLSLEEWESQYFG